MNTLNFKIGSGKLCALVAATLFFTVLLLAFPGFIPATFGSAIKYAVPILTIVGAALALTYGLTTLENRFPGILGKLGNYFAFALNCSLIFVTVGGCFIALIALEYRVLAASWATIQGASIDSNGTIIPISPLAVIALHIAVLMGAICVGRHAIYPDCKIEQKWVRVGASAAVTIFLIVFVNALVGMAIREAYVDRSAEKRTELVERIKEKEENLDKLKQELLQLEAAGK